MQTYAAYSLNNDVRMSSSSGAVFSLLANYIFSKNGVVYGVTMSEDCYFAEFIAVEDEAGLKRLRGSKYLQAKVGDTFRRVKLDLQTGREVLFTGTGCQVNGLIKYLGKNYDNLFCVDVICHGVPSPALWKKYVEHKEKQYGGKLKYINFRSKDDSWQYFGMKEVLERVGADELKKEFNSKDTDPYMQMFLRDYCLRPSCYQCVAKKEKISDLTIADFWGIDKVVPEMNDGKGVSLVLIRSEKGRAVFGMIANEMKIKEVRYEDSVKNNPAEYQSVFRPVQRDSFFGDMRKMTFEELGDKYAAPISVSLELRVKHKIKHFIKTIIKKFGGGQKHI